VQQQAADRIGRAAAVVHQLGEVRIALLVDVLDEGVEQVAEQLQGQLVLGDDRAQAQEDRILRRPAGLDGVELAGSRRAARGARRR
jgi:hypothetical protein